MHKTIYNQGSGLTFALAQQPKGCQIKTIYQQICRCQIIQSASVQLHLESHTSFLHISAFFGGRIEL